MKRLLLALFLLTISAAAQQLRIAAASDLNFALPEIANKFEHRSGTHVQISFGSSGNFFTQIKNGAPFDLFFSADSDFPRKLASEGKADNATLYRYATGRLVLWIPNGSKLDLARGLNVLLDPAVKKIAIANPKHAPYGRAAEAAMRKSGIYDRVSSKLVIGENISQTAQFVDTGNADVGLIAFALAVSPTMKSRGRFAEVSRDLYPPLEQSAVVIRASANKQEAQEFLKFLREKSSQDILRQYGFE